MIFFVYKLEFVNGKVYIGMSRASAGGPFTNRLRGHERSAKRGSDNPVHAAWRKYGAPTQTILSQHDTREECAMAEVAAIKAHDALNPAKGYNLMAGGEGLNAPVGSAVHALMREKVWSNPERSAKLKASLRGRKPSPATLEAFREWYATPEAKAQRRAIADALWSRPGFRDERSRSTTQQMTPEARAHLSSIHSGRADPRTAEGKAVAVEKQRAFWASPVGQQAARDGRIAVWSKPENRAKVKAATDTWRASDRNKEQCKQMAKLAAAVCSKRVRDTRTGIEYESQRAMAQALGLSDAAISMRVKAGKVTRL